MSSCRFPGAGQPVEKRRKGKVRAPLRLRIQLRDHHWRRGASPSTTPTSEGEKLEALFTRTREIRRGIVAAGQGSAEPNFGRDKKGG